VDQKAAPAVSDAGESVSEQAADLEEGIQQREYDSESRSELR